MAHARLAGRGATSAKPKNEEPAARPAPLSYEDKVAKAQQALKEWKRLDDDDITKADVKAWIAKYMGQLGYTPLCRIILGINTLVKPPKDRSDD